MRGLGRPGAIRRLPAPDLGQIHSADGLMSVMDCQCVSLVWFWEPLISYFFIFFMPMLFTFIPEDGNMLLVAFWMTWSGACITSNL
jgi:hypothetical protein